MKKQIIIPIVVLILFLTTKSVFAENKSNTDSLRTVRPQVRKDVRQEKPEIKEEKYVIPELKLKSSQAIYNIIRLKLTKRHTDLLKIKAKLEARIAKNPMNKDTSTATNKLKEFDAVEVLYLKDLATFDAKFTEITTSSTTPKFSDLVSQLKTASNLVKQDLNNIKKIIKEAVVLLAQSPKLEK